MEQTIPLFPCKSLHDTLNFYRSLGFEVTHEQEEPYLYASVQRGNIQLHFNRLSVWKSKNGVSLVIVPDVGAYHRTFADGLRAKYGRIPTAGYPRITRFRSGHTRFHIFDPAGNTLIFIDEKEGDKAYSWSQEPTSELAAAVENAAFLRDTYCTDEAAATVLDKALVKNPNAAPIDRARALAARAELAIALGDIDAAKSSRIQLGHIRLSDEERHRYHEELEAPDTLDCWLTTTISSA